MGAGIGGRARGVPHFKFNAYGRPVEDVSWQHFAGEPQPGDEIGPYRHEDLLRMDERFSSRLEKCFRDGTESPLSACRSYKPSSSTKIS